jgi:hypothetical protein
MNKWLELLVGLILVLVPVYAWTTKWMGFDQAALIFLKGGLIWLVILVGLLFIILGISDLKE